jgi:gas vesicle protein
MDQEQEQPAASSPDTVVMTFMTGLFAGVVIGAGIGLLCAPRKGSELRDQISDAAANVGKTVTKTTDDLVQRGRDAYGRAREVAARAGDGINQVASAAAKGFDEGLDAARDAVAERARQASYRS